MLLTALTFFIILSVLVFIHELGHYAVARLVGVRVEEFGFGLPPRIFGKKIRGTIYSLNWLPIGGFVKLAGEDPSEAEAQQAKLHGKRAGADIRQYFWARNRTERAAILLAGVVMNFLLAVGITTVLLTYGVVEPTNTVHLERIVAGGPAEHAGLKPGDIVRTVTYGTDGSTQTISITENQQLVDIAKQEAGRPITLGLERDKVALSVTVIPRTNPPKGEGALGIAISNFERHKYPWTEAPVRAVVLSAQRMWLMLSGLGNIVFRLVTGAKVKSEEISGPVGIAQVTGEAVKYGWEAVLEFTSILSLNLAVVNVLPFPALDGGRLAFVVLEKFGKKTRPDIERTIHQIGMIVLLALVALITVSDVVRLISAQ